MATGQALALQAIALTRQRGARYVWGGKTPPRLDCSGLSYHAAHRNGIRGLPHGSVAQRDWCRRNARRVSVAEAVRTPGAFMFRISARLGNHVVVSLGNNSTAEARSKSMGLGVWGGADRRVWTDCFVLASGRPAPLPSRPPAPPATGGGLNQAIRAAKRHTYREGHRNPNIKFIQVRLNTFLPAGEKLTEDGAFGSATKRAVINFQRYVKLTPDGVVGPATWNALYPGI